MFYKIQLCFMSERGTFEAVFICEDCRKSIMLKEKK